MTVIISLNAKIRVKFIYSGFILDIILNFKGSIYVDLAFGLGFTSGFCFFGLGLTSGFCFFGED